MNDPILLGLYRLFSGAFGPWAPAALVWREKLRRAKLRPEDRARISERLGKPSSARSPGRLIWLHGADAADVSVLSPLVDRLSSAGFHVLATTRGHDSAALRLPAGALRQFAPLDVPKFVTRFLDHWRPDVVLVAQSEFWPNLIIETNRRGIPLALVNGKLSARAFLLWRKLPGLLPALLRRFDVCLAQTPEDVGRLMALGAERSPASGDPIFDFTPAPADGPSLARFAARLGARPAWLALTGDVEEEDIVIDVHRRVGGQFPDLLTIIAPRHAKRASGIALRAAKFGLTARAGAGNSEGEALPQIHIAGGLPEAGLFYRAAGVAFLGKSLCGGGIDPVEAAKLGCAILYGPDVGDFEAAYAALDSAGGATRIYDAATLASELASLLLDAAELRAMGRASADAAERLGGASDKIMQALRPYLARAHIEPEA
ncbi:MAG: glycosyltransferase N-terminal domain-containing protein [Methylocella sp.]